MPLDIPKSNKQKLLNKRELIPTLIEKIKNDGEKILSLIKKSPFHLEINHIDYREITSNELRLGKDITINRSTIGMS